MFLKEGAEKLQYRPLEVGETIKRGDVFKDDNGVYLEVNKHGELFGVPVLGKEIKKVDGWFRTVRDTSKCEDLIDKTEVENILLGIIYDLLHYPFPQKCIHASMGDIIQMMEKLGMGQDYINDLAKSVCSSSKGDAESIKIVSERMRKIDTLKD